MSIQRPLIRSRAAKLPVVNRKFYYIIARLADGSRFAASVPNEPQSMQEARREASKLANNTVELRGVPWDVIESKYRDLNRVTSNLRHPIWIGSGSIAEAKQRMRHKL
jgi:hypothetical protein